VNGFSIEEALFARLSLAGFGEQGINGLLVGRKAVEGRSADWGR
jgi:hypothetical protein